MAKLLMTIKSRFSASQHPKTNALLRSLLFWVGFLLVLFVVGTFVVKLFPASGERFVYGLGGSVGALLLTGLVLKMEKRSFKDIGLVVQKTTLPSFLRGLVWGSFVFGVLLATLLFFTDLQIAKSPTPFSWLQAAAYLAIIPLAFMEELVFRAYPLLKLKQVFGVRITQIIVALGFALYHVATGWNPVIAFLGPGTWAFVFGLSAIWSGGIAMPTGIHVAVNVWQPLVGMSSGTYASLWMLQYKSAESAAQQSRTNLVGLVVQVLIFLSALLLTEYFIRNKKSLP